MKRLVLLFFFLLSLSNSIHAQNKHIKVLLQQIVALQVYIDAAQKGYSIAKKGLNTVASLKKGELNLHSVYLNSLKLVNPRIKKYVRVVEIMDLQWKIMKDCKGLSNDLAVGDLFYGDELDYIDRVFDRLINSCSTTLDDLLTVTTDGELEMKDDERLKRIDALYDTMVDNYKFIQSFNKGLKLLCLSRARDHKDTHIFNGLHGILKN